MPRGRPRKNPVTELPKTEISVQKKRGRPRKDPSPISEKIIPAHSLCEQKDHIFALDIGTRTVVGVLGENDDDVFRIIDSVVVPHNKRAVKDGQIEDIDEVAKIVSKVKNQLEQKTGINLSKVCIAAAGRALKTQHVKIDIDVDGKDNITEEMVKSFELEAISQAQSQLDKTEKDTGMSFYCVGHSVVNYFLDDYPIKSFVGHKGKVATVDILAAFLPSIVVESLYAVTDKNNLEVTSLTLEPIAAMNVIIPPEIRLINVALVDIGAGTSDIAVAKSGSIIAYAMATTAGDEITEEIIKTFLVDFDTAEKMKMNSDCDKLEYSDILGFKHTISSGEFFKTLSPAVEALSSTVAENILLANGGESPAAVFLVGGGSQIPDLTKHVSKKLSLPQNRVAVGGLANAKFVDTADSGLLGPEFVTPVGIGVTAIREKGYDFSTVTLNGAKIRIFNTNKITILDLLTIAGFKSANIIGRSGRGLTYTLNGEQKIVKGQPSSPAIITVNDMPANITTPIKQGDRITIVPAVNGETAVIKISDLTGKNDKEYVTFSGIDYPVGTIVSVNGNSVPDSYEIQNYDNVVITEIKTLGELLRILDCPTDNVEFFVGKRKINTDYVLKNGDSFIVSEKPFEEKKEPPKAEEIPEKLFPEIPEIEDEPLTEEFPEEIVPEVPEKPAEKGVTIRLNGRIITLDKPTDGADNIFLELMAIADIDTKNPKGSDILLTLNGKDANYMDVLKDGDDAVIKWVN